LRVILLIQEIIIYGLNEITNEYVTFFFISKISNT